MPLSKTWINAIERLASDTGIKVYCDLDDKRHQWNLDGKQKSNCEHHLYTITFSWHKLHDTLFARKQKFVFQFCWGISLLLPLSHWLLFSFTFLHCFVLLNWTQADYLMLHTGMIPNSSKTVWSINKTDTCQNAQLHLLSGTIIDMAKQSATEFAGYDFFWQRGLVCINPLNTDGSVIIALTKGGDEYKFGRDRKRLISFIVSIQIPNLIQIDGSDLYIHVQKKQKSGAKKRLFDWRTDFVIMLPMKVHLESYSVMTINAWLLLELLHVWNKFALGVCGYEFDPMEIYEILIRS